ncbi:MAG: Bro-N domain-containing protein [Minisyncoccia bacterium]|jgi:prophage antirepressor-like protein
MEKKKREQNTHPTIFEEKEVRRTWHDEKWYFVIADVVQILTDSKDVQGYIKDMRRRDPELSQGWGQIATPLGIETAGGKQKMNCANLEGIFRIIQSIPSPKAEPFKRWLAKVGKERIEEIADPELAVTRTKEIYDKKGYPKDWVDKRMRGIAVRNTLTDEWKSRGASMSFEFAILTDEIYKAAFDKTAKEYMKHKGLDKKAGDNLRDHMGDIELILTMLGEATTTKLSTEKDSHGLEALKNDAQIGGGVAGRTRKDIERQTGKKVISNENFKSRKLLKGKEIRK